MTGTAGKRRTAGRAEPGARGPVARIASAALPLYLTMIVSSAGALVGTAVLGRHATVSLAAFAVTTAVHTPAVAAVAGALRGVMPFVAAEREDPDALLPVVRDGMWLGIVTGLLGAAAVGAVPLIGRASGVPEETLAELGALPALLACSVLVSAVGNSATSTLVGLGRSKPVMHAGTAGTVTAVALSLLLVGGVGPFGGLGPTGAGVAMLASNLVGAAVAHRALRRSPVLAGRRLRPGRPHVRALLRLAAVGVPLAATVLVKFAVLGVLALAAARTGSESAAAHSISVSLANLVFTAAVAVGQATVPLVSPYVGGGDVRGLRGGVLAGVKVAMGAVLVLGGVLASAGEPVVSLFTGDAVLRGLVTGLLPVVLLAVVTDALQAVFGFGLVAVKDTVPGLVVFAACYGALALVAVPVAAAGGLTALWAALACANTVLVAGQAWAFHHRSARLPCGPAGTPG